MSLLGLAAFPAPASGHSRQGPQPASSLGQRKVHPAFQPTAPAGAAPSPLICMGLSGAGGWRQETAPRSGAPWQLQARAKLAAYADRQPVRLLPVPGSRVKLVDVTSCPPTCPTAARLTVRVKVCPGVTVLSSSCPALQPSRVKWGLQGAGRFLPAAGMSAPCLIACLARPTLLPTLHIEALQPVTVPTSNLKINQSTITSQTFADLLQASNAFKSTVCQKQNGE